MSKILLICPAFFGYGEEIKKHLEEEGHRVWRFDDCPGKSGLVKVALRLWPRLIRGKAERYYRDIIAQLRDEDIDEVLVIKAESLTATTIGWMREAFPRARFTLYFWDSYRNNARDSASKVPFFDRAFTFDPEDAASDPRLTLQPLFYLDRFARLPEVEMDIDLLFVGTAHSDRYAVVKRIEAALPPGVRFTRVLYVAAPWIYSVRRLIDPAYWRARRSEFVFTPVSRAELMTLIARARIVVDIERAVQTGLTIRTIEMLGAGKKLLSTNPRSVDAEFYHPDNIAVMDRHHPVIDEAFLSRPYAPPAPEVHRRYSLSGWLEVVLGK